MNEAVSLTPPLQLEATIVDALEVTLEFLQQLLQERQ